MKPASLPSKEGVAMRRPLRPPQTLPVEGLPYTDPCLFKIRKASIMFFDGGFFFFVVGRRMTIEHLLRRSVHRSEQHGAKNALRLSGPLCGGHFPFGR